MPHAELNVQNVVRDCLCGTSEYRLRPQCAISVFARAQRRRTRAVRRRTRAVRRRRRRYNRPPPGRVVVNGFFEKSYSCGDLLRGPRAVCGKRAIRPAR